RRRKRGPGRKPRGAVDLDGLVLIPERDPEAAVRSDVAAAGATGVRGESGRFAPVCFVGPDRTVFGKRVDAPLRRRGGVVDEHVTPLIQRSGERRFRSECAEGFRGPGGTELVDAARVRVADEHLAGFLVDPNVMEPGRERGGTADRSASVEGPGRIDAVVL